MMLLDPHRPVHRFVTDHLAAARVFDRHGIDYCCHGDESLEESCRKRQLDPNKIIEELSLLDMESAPNDFFELGLGDLADHIVHTHHVFLRTELPALTEKVEKVLKAHGDRDPRLLDVRRVLLGLRSELEHHMQKEEQILFPLCHQLGDPDSQEAALYCGSVRAPISVMVSEHEEAGSALDHLKELTDGFAVPDDSCATHRSMIFELARLEADLHRHIHKENYILFPRALAQEAAAS